MLIEDFERSAGLSFDQDNLAVAGAGAAGFLAGAAGFLVNNSYFLTMSLWHLHSGASDN